MLAHPAMPWVINWDFRAPYRNRPKMSPRHHCVPLPQSQYHVINPTNPRRALDDGVQDRLHVRGGAADDGEDFGRCRLMLQGFAQFCVALLDLFEQPHILNCDDSLISEGFKERDLLVSKRTDFGTPNKNRPDWNALAQQRRGKCGSGANAFLILFAVRKLRFNGRLQIVNVDRLLVDHGSAVGRAASDELPGTE